MDREERRTTIKGLTRLLVLFSLVFAAIDIIYGLGIALRPQARVGVVDILVSQYAIPHEVLVVWFFSFGFLQLFVTARVWWRLFAFRVLLLSPHIIYASISVWYIFTHDIALTGANASVVIMILALFVLWLEAFMRQLIEVLSDG